MQKNTKNIFSLLKRQSALIMQYSLTHNDEDQVHERHLKLSVEGTLFSNLHKAFRVCDGIDINIMRPTQQPIVQAVQECVRPRDKCWINNL